MNMLHEIRSGFHKAEGLYRLLFLNIFIYVALKLIALVLFLTGSGGTVNFVDFLAVSAYLPDALSHPWTFFSYMFIHEGFFHILFNMLILYWLGKIFCEYLGTKKIVPIYIMGGLAGAALYILFYNLFPVFSDSLRYSKLIGASAGVIAVMVSIATLIPDYSIHLMFIGPVRLKYVAGVSIVLYVISIPDGNAGGNIAHLGGAIMGFVYTKMLQKGTNIGGWLESIADMVTGQGKPRMKVVKKSKSDSTIYHGGTVKQREVAIDKILEKISRSGYESLTQEEKDILFKASKRK
jgi:rhomboid family protein